MSSKDSYFQRNPLFNLKTALPPPHPHTILPSPPKFFYEKEEDFDKFLETTKTHSPTIYELNYYNHSDYPSLPTNGWIRLCIDCFARTGSTMIYVYQHDYRPTKHKYFRIHMCVECKKKRSQQLQNQIASFITKYVKHRKYYAPFSV